MKAITLYLAAGALIAAIIGLTAAPAMAQTALPAPTNIRVTSGSNAGEATVSWDAVNGVAFYRIGWVAFDDIAVVQADGRSWLDAFAFMDVANNGQVSQTLTGLKPGTLYAFIAASVSNRFGAGNWSQWTYMTTAEVLTSCPTDGGAAPLPPQSAAPTPTPVPTPTITPTPTPTPTPVGDYDSDNDGLIELDSLAQLNAIRHDWDGDGRTNHRDYAAAFPNALSGMGCPSTGCSGYELVADLDLDTNGSGKADAGDAYWNGGWGWTPVGDPDPDYRFKAVFDGGGHTISNLYIRWGDTDHVGLFRVTGSDSIIRNVGLVSVDVIGKNYTGSLVGSNHGTITNSYATGKVSGNSNTGGLVGTGGDNITIIASHFTGSVNSNESVVGGLVGNTGNAATITASYATGNVAGKNSVGGLAGSSNAGTTVTASYAMSSVSGRFSVRTFRTSSNVRSVSDGSGIGGLIGISTDTTISASYTTGTVAGASAVGGLIGRASSNSIATSYTATRVSLNHASGGRIRILPVGLIGRVDDETVITESYWDSQVAGLTGGNSKTTRELQSPTANVGIYAAWNPDWWDFGNSRQYPALQYGSMDADAQRR